MKNDLITELSKLSKEQLNIYLKEVKEGMETANESNNILDTKIQNIINFIIPILFGLLAVLFTRDDIKNINDIKIPSIILFAGVGISCICLSLSCIVGKYYLKGDLMDDFDNADKYYHKNNNNILIYLIYQYKIKATENFKKNSFKGNLINISICILILSAIISFISFIFFIW